MSCGIYKITNKINQKCYIGCSKNIEKRWNSHKSESVLDQFPQYNYSIHKAFRKYGLDNFSFEIIEEIDENKLFDREKYWISFYNSYNCGYNETEGGDCGPVMFGEDNPNAKLTEADVVYIRRSILEGKMPSEIFPLYKDRISKRGFDHIWRGEDWINILPEAIEYSKSQEYKQRIKSFAGKSAVSQEKQIIRKEIKRKKEEGLNRLEVYKEYQNIYSLSGFNKVWYK